MIKQGDTVYIHYLDADDDEDQMEIEEDIQNTPTESPSLTKGTVVLKTCIEDDEESTGIIVRWSDDGYEQFILDEYVYWNEKFNRWDVGLR